MAFVYYAYKKITATIFIFTQLVLFLITLYQIQLHISPQVPYVFMFPAALHGPMAQTAGSVTFSSFAHNALFTYKHPYSFLERMVLSVTDVASYIVFIKYVTYK